MSEIPANNPADFQLPPDREFFAIGRLGLPLNLRDNLICALAIILAVALQIRFQHTLLGEGWFALLGAAGYLALRLWLLRRRYPDPGEMLVGETAIHFPASLGTGKAEIVQIEDIEGTQANFFRTRTGEILTSIEIICARRQFVVSWLSTDLNRLERVLLRRRLRVTRIYGDYGKMLMPALLVLIFVLLLIIIQALHR